MKVSIVIATYGRESCLVDTIRSVMAQDYPAFELLVVDQSPRHLPEVQSFLREFDDPRYRYFLVTPPSLPAARNFGLSQSTGDIIVYIDDDVVLEPDFIQAHVETYRESPQIGAVGGRVRVPGEGISEHLFRFEPDGTTTGELDIPDEEADLETARGCNMSFRRVLLEQLGGFDPSYQGNALREETDMCFRLRARGYRVRYAARAMLTHLVAQSGGCREEDLWTAPLYYQNETLFYIRRMNWTLFWLFFQRSWLSRVWPWKQTPSFNRRLRSFIVGFAGGFWRLAFPRRLKAKLVWQSPRRQGSRLPENARA